MKRLLAILIFLPCFTFANTMLEVGWGQISFPQDSDEVDGVNVGLIHTNNHAILKFEYWDANDIEADQSHLSIAFAFDDFTSGSMYAGLSIMDGDALDETGYVVGYQKLSRIGTDYNLSASVYDGNVVYGIDVISESGFMISLEDFAGEFTATRVGYNFSF